MVGADPVSVEVESVGVSTAPAPSFGDSEVVGVAGTTASTCRGVGEDDVGVGVVETRATSTVWLNCPELITGAAWATPSNAPAPPAGTRSAKARAAAAADDPSVG